MRFMIAVQHRLYPSCTRKHQSRRLAIFSVARVDGFIDFSGNESALAASLHTRVAIVDADAAGGNDAVQPHHAARILFAFKFARKNIFADLRFIIDPLFRFYILAEIMSGIEDFDPVLFHDRAGLPAGRQKRGEVSE